MDGTKISQLPLLQEPTGLEDGVVALNGQNFRFKLSSIKGLFTKADVGLGNVDNTSDADKPVSTATQAALDGKAASEHDHAIADVNGLQAALDGKAPTLHDHPIGQVDGLQAALDGKANTDHTQSIESVDGLTEALTGKAPAIHGHSISDVNNLGSTLQGLQDQVNGKASAVHTHPTSQIDDLDDHIVQVVTDAGFGTGDVAVGALQW